MGENTHTIEISGDITPGKYLVMYNAETGSLLLNLESSNPNYITKDPSTPSPFRDLSKLKIWLPEIQKRRKT